MRCTRACRMPPALSIAMVGPASPAPVKTTGFPAEINYLIYCDLTCENNGVTTISPSVFQGPTGTQSTSGPGTGQAGRIAVEEFSMPHAKSRLHCRSLAAEQAPCNNGPIKAPDVVRL